MLVLVTGANGFIGKNLCKTLAQVGINHYPVFRKEWDLVNDSQVKSLYEKVKPTHVVHLAGNPLVSPNKENPYKILDDNVLMSYVLLHNASQNTRFVYASSATVYGTYVDFPGKAGFSEHEIPHPNSVYGVTKLASEALVESYARQGQITGCILRLVANVGPNPTHGLIKAIVDKLRTDSETLDLLGQEDGSIKPYIHVSDTVNAIIKALKYKSVINTFNICPFHSDVLSVKQVAQSVMNELDIKKPIRWMGAETVWKGDNPHVRVSNIRARAVLGWCSTQTSDSAIRTAAREYYGEVNG